MKKKSYGKPEGSRKVSRNMAEMEIIKKTIAGLPLTEMLKKVEKVAQFSSKSSIE